MLINLICKHWIYWKVMHKCIKYSNVRGCVSAKLFKRLTVWYYYPLWDWLIQTQILLDHFLIWYKRGSRNPL